MNFEQNGRCDQKMLLLKYFKVYIIFIFTLVGQVMDYAVDCILFDMGITKRVYVNKNDEIQSFEYVNYEGKLTLILKWKNVSEPQKIQLFSSVKLSLEANEKSTLDFNARIMKP